MTKITKAQVVRAAKEAVARTPDAVNPYVRPLGGSIACMYHTGRGKNVKRCIAGQIGWDLGLPTPEAMEGDIEDVAGEGGTWEGRFTPGAVAYLLRLQEAADGEWGKRPIPWGEIPRIVVAGRRS